MPYRFSAKPAAGPTPAAGAGPYPLGFGGAHERRMRHRCGLSPVKGEPTRRCRSLLEPAFGDLGLAGSVGLAGALAFGIITLAHVVAGELAPKSLAIARTEQVALLVAPPMRVFYAVTKPIVDAFNWMGNLLLRPFGIPPAREVGHAPPTEDELHLLIRESARRGLIDADESLLAEKALTFDDLRVRQIMVPRRKLPYVTTDADIATAVDHLRRA